MPGGQFHPDLRACRAIAEIEIDKSNVAFFGICERGVTIRCNGLNGEACIFDDLFYFQGDENLVLDDQNLLAHSQFRGA